MSHTGSNDLKKTTDNTAREVSCVLKKKVQLSPSALELLTYFPHPLDLAEK